MQTAQAIFCKSLSVSYQKNPQAISPERTADSGAGPNVVSETGISQRDAVPEYDASPSVRSRASLKSTACLIPSSFSALHVL